jgi:hypothetical protein
MTAALTSAVLKLDLNLRQGEGATITLTTVDRNGAVITSTAGYTIRAQIRRTTNGPILFEWNTSPSAGQGTAVLTYDAGPPTASTTTLVHTASQSSLWAFRLAQWDCFIIPPIGEPACLAAGAVRIDPCITHQ